MRLYIAGPMRGYPQYNFPAFMAAAEELAEDGFDVVNPAQRDVDAGFDPDKSLEEQGGLTLKDFMRRDLPLILECDALYMLPGWEHSEGAKLERHVAQAVGMKVLYHPEAVVDPVLDRLQRGVSMRQELNA